MINACQTKASEWIPLLWAKCSGTFNGETLPLVVASKTHWHPFYGGVTCVNGNATIELQLALFFSSIFSRIFSRSSPYESMKVSCYLFFIFNLVLTFFFYYCLVFYIFFNWFFSFSFVLVIWFDLIFISNLIFNFLIF